MAVQRARRNADALNELWGECVIAKIRPESVPPLDDPNPNPELQPELELEGEEEPAVDAPREPREGRAASKQPLGTPRAPHAANAPKAPSIAAADILDGFLPLGGKAGAKSHHRTAAKWSR